MALDKNTFVGIALAVAGIGIGTVLEGGALRQLMQPTAALIVLGGTLGAVLVQFPFTVVAQAFADEEIRQIWLWIKIPLSA